MLSPNVRAPTSSTWDQRESRIQRVLPVHPQVRSLLVISRRRKPEAAVFLGDVAHDVHRLLDRSLCWALEFEVEAVLLRVLPQRHAVQVRRPHKVIVAQLNTF